MRLSAWATAIALLAAAALVAGRAAAEPQLTAGLTVGLAGVAPATPDKPLAAAPSRAFWKQTDFHLGLRTEVLFFRDRNDQFGLGPYAEVLTHAFDEIQLGGGASLLVPVLDNLPIVVSGGLYARKADDGYGFTPGVAGTVFWGSRSHNFEAPYGLGAGLVGELRYGLGPNHETAIVIAAQLDVVALTLPFVLLASALHGPSSEAAPIR